MNLRLVMHLFTLLVFLVLFQTGCDQIPIPGLGTSQPVASPTRPTPNASDTPTTPSGQATPPATTQSGAVTLRLWLPPEFDPGSGSEAGALLQEHLDEFEARRPNVRVEVRVKALEGTGGIINTLTAANLAAPLSLPDVAALPRRFIETSIQKGLVYPFEELDFAQQDDWFDYASAFGNLQEGSYALPFAGDALVMAYRPELVELPPASWDDILQTTIPFLFPAASSQGLFTLAQYLAVGGVVQDAEGRPLLEEAPLAAVYAFFQQASTGEQMPFWITQYENDEQVWQAYLDGRSPLAVTWFSNYLGDAPGDTSLAPIPTRDGEPFTLATGWVWVLTNPDPERRTLGQELAEFLSRPDFLARWTQAAGYLPTRRSVLANWHDVALQNLAERIILSARPYPAADVLNIIGPALQETTSEVLKQQNGALEAARKAVGRINSP